MSRRGSSGLLPGASVRRLELLGLLVYCHTAACSWRMQGGVHGLRKQMNVYILHEAFLAEELLAVQFRWLVSSTGALSCLRMVC